MSRPKTWLVPGTTSLFALGLGASAVADIGHGALVGGAAQLLCAALVLLSGLVAGGMAQRVPAWAPDMSLRAFGVGGLLTASALYVLLHVLFFESPAEMEYGRRAPAAVMSLFVAVGLFVMAQATGVDFIRKAANNLIALALFTGMTAVAGFIAFDGSRVEWTAAAIFAVLALTTLLGWINAIKMLMTAIRDR